MASTGSKTSNQSVRGELLSQAREYARLMRLDRPIGIWLLLWPTLWALWIAGEGRPDPLVFSVFVAGVVVMRSAPSHPCSRVLSACCGVCHQSTTTTS